MQESWLLNGVAGGGSPDRWQWSKGLRRLCGHLEEWVPGKKEPGKSLQKEHAWYVQTFP